MPIREKGYYNWDGELKKSYVKWLPIFLNGIKSVFKKKKSRLVFIFTASSFLVFLAAVYISTKPELKMLTHLVEQIKLSDALLFKTYYSNGFLIFCLMILSLFAGADLISGDLKFKSFTLYLSRPLSRFDYIKGKMSVVLFYLLMFSLVPGILLILAKIIFSGSFAVPLPVVFAALVFPLLISLFIASFTLMLSSLSANQRFVIILFIGIYLASNMIAGIFTGAFRDKRFLLISFDMNIRQFGAYIFDTGLHLEVPGWVSGAILLSLTVIFLTILSLRIKRAEV